MAPCRSLPVMIHCSTFDGMELPKKPINLKPMKLDLEKAMIGGFLSLSL